MAGMNTRIKLLLPLIISSFAISSCKLSFDKPAPEKEIGEFTLLIYMTGGDLESSLIGTRIVYGEDDELYAWNMCGEATCDIKEILSVPNKPNDVNIVIQTGGSTAWTPNVYGEYGDYDIDATKIQRHHVASNQKLVLDQTLERTSMGAQETLQSFVEYGLTNYPARRTGLILWGHGGGLSGVCLDAYPVEGYIDRLYNNEVAGAMENALRNTGHAGEKLEFIGYDACYMAVQDVMEFNSHYFKYMIATPEEEAGYGWLYGSWIDDLYAKKKTTEILNAIAYEYVYSYDRDLGGTYHDVLHYNNSHSMGYFNLLKFETYRRAWENMAKNILITASNRSQFYHILADSKQYNYGYFDSMHFISLLENDTQFSGKPDASYITAVKDAYNALAKKVTRGQMASNHSEKYSGLMFPFIYMTSSNIDYYLNYNSSQTNFVEWYQLVFRYRSFS